MRYVELPDELQQMEHWLKCDAQPAPSTALRGRVLNDVHHELHGRYSKSKRRLVGGLAAAVFLGVSFMLSHAASFVVGQTAGPSPIRELAKRIQCVSPDIGPEEAVRRAMLVELASQVGCRSPLCDVLDAHRMGQRLERAVQ